VRNMKSRILLLCVFVLLAGRLFATIWRIKQDGTGNFTTIQEGINAALDDDTILVYPGTYQENIDYLEKSLTVGSLYMTTHRDSLIDQTIIDGNEENRCVTIEDCSSASLVGFTLKNGTVMGNGWTSGSGGGVLINNVSSSCLSHCKVINNTAYSGGGVYIVHSDAQLRGNIISHNWGIQCGGGLCFTGNDTEVLFDDTDLNSFYLNYSATGSDIYIGYSIQGIVAIVADTLTVTEPDYFFIGPPPQCTVSQQNAKILEIDQDLYVAPYGDDANSGISPDEPLQTLAWAQTLIKRNDDTPHTIHCAEGVYSPSLNNQVFPMNIKKGVTFEGVSPDNTIFDAESEFPFFHQNSRPQDEFSTLIMKNLKLLNGECLKEARAGGIVIYQADLRLDTVIIENCNGDFAGAIQLLNGFCEMNNVIIRDNYGTCAVSFVNEYNNPNPVSYKKVTNSSITNNHPSVIEPDFPGGIAFRVSGHSNIPGDYHAEFINCEITCNHNASYPLSGLGGTSAIHIKDFIDVDIVNCTIGDNMLDYDTGCSITVDTYSSVNVYNSILYGNEGYSFTMMQASSADFSYSLIEGGNSNIHYYYPLANVNWHDGNLAADPLWLENGEYPYYLQAESPCIDAGTLDLPAGIELPEFDLAGNPRIFGNAIDMGAYEWQGTGIEEPEIPPTSPRATHLTAFPNPCKPSGAGRNPATTIKLELAEAGKIELAIYNIKGQKIKTLMQCTTVPGTFDCQWDGKDDAGNAAASGQYIVMLKQNGRETAAKIMLLK
jgi:hypothetical protein